MTQTKILIVAGLLLICVIAAWAMSKATGDNHTEGVFIGVFREGAPANINHIKNFARDAGKKPAMIMWYQDWKQSFPAEDVQKVVAYGATPHIVWEARYWGNDSKVTLKDIIDGKWDDYIRSWAKAIKASKETVFLRIGHEFNVGVYPWGVGNNNKDADLYIKAYRHIVNVFKKENVKNVKWIWCFNNYSNPDEPWNDWAKAYPGDDYVDWVGIDGYNWGKTQEWSGWEDFKTLFRSQMRRAKKLWPDKPIMIAEFASAEKGGDKAAWIRQLPGLLKSSMRDIDAIVWFDIKKEADWRVKSSKKSAAAFKEIMKDPVFLSSGEALVKFTPSAKVIKKKTAVARKAPAQVTIDADLSDWDKSSPITMKDKSFFKEGIDWQGTQDLSGNAYVMWDNDYLYLAAMVNDMDPMVNKQTKQNIWNGDAIEVVIGLDPKAKKDRTRFWRKDYQIGLGTGDGKGNQPTIWNWQRRRVPEGSEIAVKKMPDGKGYVLESKIPWKFFKAKFVPAKGKKVDFDIAFDDADKTGKRERQFIWNGDFMFYKDPSVWGTLELK
jgi:hypothetical protein